ncbi:anti-sigma factor [Rhodoferax sp.]|uniref:anti-sigma factor domain-containing protein n=3 Tax=Rhodoferax sp. TaxID=50421 RepID=UPI00260B2B9E|nr:anti-sigma factor [Rhodoferax sp.]MDD5478342.1 anti-sigma factor [Rhodoferax sp.]
MTEATAPTPEVIPPYTTGWRLLAISLLVVVAVGAATGVGMYEMFNAQITHLQAKLKNVPQTKYVAVLLDAKQAPGMLVTFDPQDSFVMLQRLTDIKEGPDDSMQLWDNTDPARPVSLGVLTPKLRTAQLPMTEKTLAKVTQLAISVENRGGTEPGNMPLLPYLYSGALILKAL